MALPFIVGPHQCALTCGPEGHPQIELTSRLRLPIAELVDALLVLITERQAAPWQTGKGAHNGPPTPAMKAPAFIAPRGSSKGPTP